MKWKHHEGPTLHATYTLEDRQRMNVGNVDAMHAGKTLGALGRADCPICHCPLRAVQGTFAPEWRCGCK